MKHLYFLLTIVIFGHVIHSCDLRTSNVSSAEKIKQDSIFKSDSIKSVFSKMIKESNHQEVYKIKSGVKLILADNQDTYIVKGDLPPTKDTYVEIYSSDERNGDVIIIYWSKEQNSIMEFIVTETLNNLTEAGYETIYICKYIKDIKHTYSITKTQNKEKITISFRFDFNTERNAYMQWFVLVPENKE